MSDAVLKEVPAPVLKIDAEVWNLTDHMTATVIPIPVDGGGTSLSIVFTSHAYDEPMFDAPRHFSFTYHGPLDGVQHDTCCAFYTWLYRVRIPSDEAELAIEAWIAARWLDHNTAKAEVS